MAYRSDDRSDRWKAMGAVLAVHIVLGAVIITGLNVEIISRAVEKLETFDIALDQPPPEEPPPQPRLEPERAPDEAGAPGKTADPTPIVAPEPEIRIPTESPVATSQTPGTGTASSSGAGTAGTGTGAGGTGSGRGGGGSGAGFTPARLINKIPDSDYRRIAGNRLPRGSVVITFRVGTDGRPSDCRVVRSSGDSGVDSAICPIAVQRLRFRPARDASGRPVAQQITYVPTWRR